MAIIRSTLVSTLLLASLVNANAYIKARSEGTLNSVHCGSASTAQVAPSVYENAAASQKLFERDLTLATLEEDLETILDPEFSGEVEDDDEIDLAKRDFELEDLDDDAEWEDSDELVARSSDLSESEAKRNGSRPLRPHQPKGIKGGRPRKHNGTVRGRPKHAKGGRPGRKHNGTVKGRPKHAKGRGKGRHNGTAKGRPAHPKGKGPKPKRPHRRPGAAKGAPANPANAAAPPAADVPVAPPAPEAVTVPPIPVVADGSVAAAAAIHARDIVDGSLPPPPPSDDESVFTESGPITHPGRPKGHGRPKGPHRPKHNGTRYGRPKHGGRPSNGTRYGKPRHGPKGLKGPKGHRGQLPGHRVQKPNGTAVTYGEPRLNTGKPFRPGRGGSDAEDNDDKLAKRDQPRKQSDDDWEDVEGEVDVDSADDVEEIENEDVEGLEGEVEEDENEMEDAEEEQEDEDEDEYEDAESYLPGREGTTAAASVDLED